MSQGQGRPPGLVGSMAGRRGLIGLALAVSWVMGCTAIEVTPYSGRPTTPRAMPAAHLAGELGLRPTGGALTGLLSDPREVHRGLYTRWAFEADSTGDNRQPGKKLRGLYYRSSRPGPKPIVVVLPIWGKSAYPPKVTTQHLLEGPSAGDLHVLRLFGENTLHDWAALARQRSEATAQAEVHRWAKAMGTNAIDVRGVFAWAASRPEVDERRIGLVGFSIGAIVGALAYGFDPPPGAAVFVLGGGDLAKILSTCNDGGARGRRELQLALGWSPGTFRRTMEPIVASVNPIHYLATIDPGTVLIIDAARDNCIRKDERDRFWEALGRPERVTVKANHKTFFKSMTPFGGHKTTRRIATFLHHQLVESSPPVVTRAAVAAERRR